MASRPPQEPRSSPSGSVRLDCLPLPKSQPHVYLELKVTLSLPDGHSADMQAWGGPGLGTHPLGCWHARPSPWPHS